MFAKPLIVAVEPLSLEINSYFFSPFAFVYSIFVYMKLELVGLVQLNVTSPGPALVVILVTFSGAASLTEILPSSSPQELIMADREHKITVERRTLFNGNFSKSFFINYKFKINTII